MGSTVFKAGLVVALHLHGVSAAPVPGILDAHNGFRELHDADPLVYDATLEANAQVYADVLANSCGSLVHDPALNGEGENLYSCTFIGTPADDSCLAGTDATQSWYDEVRFYVPGETGTSNTPGEEIGHFTQVVWKSSTTLGCASAACEFPYTGDDTYFQGQNWQRTYVVCRYAPPGNYLTQYYDNVSITCVGNNDCDDVRGEICCPTKKVCEVPPDATTPNACGDPHMTGFKGQRFDFTGEDGAWYAVVSDVPDQADQPSTHINMRVTSPVASLPEITYITGLSVITTDADGLDHSIVIEVTDPHSLESSCPVGLSPCLADGALTVEIDGKETLLAPGTVQVGSGVAVSAVNLPGACRSFGFKKYWEAKQKEQAKAGRKLGVVTGLQDMAEWILGDPTATNLAECAQYVASASSSGEDGLFAHDSEHASFQIMTLGTVIRLSHGRLHQLPMRDPTDQYDLPDHRTWQMNLALEHNGLSSGASGILGETQVPTVNADGHPIMKGMESIRGTPEDYRVEGSLDIFFAQGQRHE
eukprot:g10010.t1